MQNSDNASNAVSDNATATQSDAATAPDNAAATVPAVVTESEKKKRIAKARVYNADGTIMQVGDNAQSFVDYVAGFHKVAPQKGSGGYTSFVTTEDAYTNRNMIENFSVQGIGKQLALLVHRAADIIIDGDSEEENTATEMSGILNGLTAYMGVVIESAKIQREQNALNGAIQNLAKARGCSLDDARKQLTAFLSQPQVPTGTAPVVAVEPTIGESGASVEEAASTDGEAPAPAATPAKLSNKERKRLAREGATA